MTTRKKGKIVAEKIKRSLIDYRNETVMAQAKAKCKICALPEAVRLQIKDVRERNLTTTKVISNWLRDEFQVNLANVDFQSHSSGRHEAE